MKDIDEYIKKPITERQEHLILDEPCIERGGASMYLKGLLAHILETTIPSGRKVHVCHACHNSKCSNPNHLYWGTARENRLDEVSNGGINVWQRTVNKHGLDKAKEIFSKNANPSLAGRGNKGKKKSEEHKRKISEAIKKKHAEKR